MTGELELRVRDGRAVVTYPDGDAPALPAELRAALAEWATVVSELPSSGADRELVSRRGRQLAERLSAATGCEVVYVDPLVTGPEPTPWATGLTVSVASAALVLVAMVALAEALADVAPWAPAAGLLVAGAGLAPSVWIARGIPVWRWVAYGIAAGVGLSWVFLLA